MSMTELLRSAMTPKQDKPSILDSAEENATELAGADDYTINDIKLSTIAAIQQWTETDDLDEGETSADRLMALIVGIADANKDGEITDDETGVLEVALNAAWDYFVESGVSEEDADALLNDWENDTAERVRDLIAAQLPDGEDAASAEIDDFVFGDDQEAMLDAVYKKRLVIRKGKKVRIRKRISGTVRLSAKQKLAIRKARRKSHSAGAMMRRMKSMRMRRRMGL